MKTIDTTESKTQNQKPIAVGVVGPAFQGARGPPNQRPKSNFVDVDPSSRRSTKS
jgi:hypothetical protein